MNMSYLFINQIVLLKNGDGYHHSPIANIIKVIHFLQPKEIRLIFSTDKYFRDSFCRTSDFKTNFTID